MGEGTSDADAATWRAAALRAQAAAFEDQAARSRDLAADLARRAEVVAGRLGPVRVRHVAATWTSAAAERSRRMLHEEVAFGVSLALDDLAETIRLLVAAAAGWDEAARATRREAATASPTPGPAS
jgi:hypothetical protein